MQYCVSFGQGAETPVRCPKAKLLKPATHRRRDGQLPRRKGCDGRRAWWGLAGLHMCTSLKLHAAINGGNSFMSRQQRGGGSNGYWPRGRVTSGCPPMTGGGSAAQRVAGGANNEPRATLLSAAFF
ncbi:unnamed protein product [Cuscuta epithymum]|uniref:Uncharacterized protein n=1 Tax=Cuscuta epithymum TaxID=186058 RepID=A0AAV0C7E3_9ASTE|nr:unnamed protein product [Cuscuta epithymum]